MDRAKPLRRGGWGPEDGVLTQLTRRALNLALGVAEHLSRATGRQCARQDLTDSQLAPADRA